MQIFRRFILLQQGQYVSRQRWWIGIASIRIETKRRKQQIVRKIHINRACPPLYWSMWNTITTKSTSEPTRIEWDNWCVRPIQTNWLDRAPLIYTPNRQTENASIVMSGPNAERRSISHIHSVCLRLNSKHKRVRAEAKFRMRLRLVPYDHISNKNTQCKSNQRCAVACWCAPLFHNRNNVNARTANERPCEPSCVAYSPVYKSFLA